MCICAFVFIQQCVSDTFCSFSSLLKAKTQTKTKSISLYLPWNTLFQNYSLLMRVRWLSAQHLNVGITVLLSFIWGIYVSVCFNVCKCLIFINAHIWYMQSSQSNKLQIHHNSRHRCCHCLPSEIFRDRAVTAQLALVNSVLSGCNHQSLAVTTPERN